MPDSEHEWHPTNHYESAGVWDTPPFFRSQSMKLFWTSADLLLKSAVICSLALLLLPANAQDTPKRETHGINVGNMDRSQVPGDHWYLYCNGDWIKRTELPPDRAGFGVFAELGDLSDKHLRPDRRNRQEQCRPRHRQSQDRRPVQLLHG